MTLSDVSTGVATRFFCDVMGIGKVLSATRKGPLSLSFSLSLAFFFEGAIGLSVQRNNVGKEDDQTVRSLFVFFFLSRL